MSASDTTFTVEVLGFPSDADPEALAGSVAEFFGIPIEEGRRLVKKRPIRVKRNAPAAVAQQLVKQLRRLGADVLVRNEQTGEERAYHAKGAKSGSKDKDAEPTSSRESVPDGSAGPLPRVVPSIAPPSTRIDEEDLIPPAPAVPPEDTLVSEDGDAPPEPAPSVEVISGPREAPISEPRAPVSSEPGEPASAPGPRPSSPRSQIASEPGERPSSDREIEPARGSSPSSPKGGPSLPPPAAPIVGLPPPTQGKLDFCGSCNRPLEKGDVCARCGWSNGEKVRHCRTCKKKLVLVSGVTRRTSVVVLLGVLAVAVAAGVFFVFGPFVALSAFGLCGAFVFVGDALSLRYACKTCTVAVYTERLQKEETDRIGVAKRKAFALAGACGVVAIGLFAGSSSSARTISDAGYGFAWTLSVPGTHSRVTSEVTQISLPAGAKRMRVQRAERPYLGGPVYFLTHVQYTYPAGSAELDKPALVALAKQTIEAYFGGRVAGSIDGAGESVQASFTGTFQNRSISGRLRATQYEHDMVVVAVVSPNPADLQDGSVEQALGAVTVQRDTK